MSTNEEESESGNLVLEKVETGSVLSETETSLVIPAKAGIYASTGVISTGTGISEIITNEELSFEEENLSAVSLKGETEGVFPQTSTGSVLAETVSTSQTIYVRLIADVQGLTYPIDLDPTVFVKFYDTGARTFAPDFSTGGQNGAYSQTNNPGRVNRGTESLQTG